MSKEANEDDTCFISFQLKSQPTERMALSIQPVNIYSIFLDLKENFLTIEPGNSVDVQVIF